MTTLTHKSLPELWADHGAKIAATQELYNAVPADGDPSADLVKQVSDLNKEIEEIEHAIKDATDRKSAFEAQRAQTAARAAASVTPVYGQPFPGDNPTTTAASKGRTFADLVLADAGMKQFLDRMVTGGQVARAQFGHSPRAALDGVGLKTLVTGASDTSGGAFVTTQRMPFVDLGWRPFTIRDIITIGATTSDTVDFPRIVSRTNNAGTVAEATAAGDGSGVKPESGMVAGIVTIPVKTIAHTLPASRRSLADAGVMRTLINSLLINGLEEEWEDQVIAGDGVGENVTGLLNYTGTTAQAYTTNLLTTLRQARTKVRTVGRAMPTAYLMNPNDWEDLDLLQDNEARYFFGGPSVLGSPRLWGLPVVESEAMTEGTAMVGDFRQVVWFDREMTQVFMSDSHADFFIRNLIMFLAELRGALGVWNPAALVEIDLTA